MRFLSLFALTLFAAPAAAQCQNGVCAVPGAVGYKLPPAPPGYHYAVPGQPNAIPPQPSGDSELWFEGGRYVWKVKAGVAVPKAMEPGVPADIVKMYKDGLAKKAEGPAVVGAEPKMHGGLFYRTVRSRAERTLADKLVSEKGYKPADARAEAKKLVASLDDRTIDVIGRRLANIKEGLGDGTFIDWLIDHKAEILELVKFIVSLLMMFADPPSPSAVLEPTAGDVWAGGQVLDVWYWLVV